MHELPTAHVRRRSAVSSVADASSRLWIPADIRPNSVGSNRDNALRSACASQIKYDPAYQERRGIAGGPAKKLAPGLRARIQQRASESAGRYDRIDAADAHLPLAGPSSAKTCCISDLCLVEAQQRSPYRKSLSKIA